MTKETSKIETATVGKRKFFRRIFEVKYFLIIAIVIFIVLAVLARNIPYFQFDLNITRAVQRITFSGFYVTMLWLTNMGNFYIASMSAVFISIILFMLKKINASLMVVISSVGASSLGVLFKTIVARPRPDSLLIHQLGLFVNPDSFPSGHVLFFMGLYGFLFVFIFTQFKKSLFRGVLLATLLLLLISIGFSRIYVGAHWFSDVLGSYLIGFVWLYFITYLYNKYDKKNHKS